MIRCDKCGVHGSPRIRELGDKYYRDFYTEGVPIYISMVDDSGHLCGECIRKMGESAAMEFMQTTKRGRSY